MSTKCRPAGFLLPAFAALLVTTCHEALGQAVNTTAGGGAPVQGYQAGVAKDLDDALATKARQDAELGRKIADKQQELRQLQEHLDQMSQDSQIKAQQLEQQRHELESLQAARGELHDLKSCQESLKQCDKDRDDQANNQCEAGTAEIARLADERDRIKADNDKLRLTLSDIAGANHEPQVAAVPPPVCPPVVATPGPDPMPRTWTSTEIPDKRCRIDTADGIVIPAGHYSVAQAGPLTQDLLNKSGRLDRELPRDVIIRNSLCVLAAPVTAGAFAGFYNRSGLDPTVLKRSVGARSGLGQNPQVAVDVQPVVDVAQGLAAAYAGSLRRSGTGQARLPTLEEWLGTVVALDILSDKERIEHIDPPAWTVQRTTLYQRHWTASDCNPYSMERMVFAAGFDRHDPSLPGSSLVQCVAAAFAQPTIGFYVVESQP